MSQVRTRIIACRDCGKEITFLRPLNPAARIIPIEPGGTEQYVGTDRHLPDLPDVSPIRLATPERGSFYFTQATAEVLRLAHVPIQTITAYEVHNCPPGRARWLAAKSAAQKDGGEPR